MAITIQLDPCSGKPLLSQWLSGFGGITPTWNQAQIKACDEGYKQADRQADANGQCLYNPLAFVWIVIFEQHGQSTEQAYQDQCQGRQN